MRAKRIAPVVVLAGLPLAALLLWYLGRPALVKAYYTRVFAGAQTITISRSAHLHLPPFGSRTIHRRDHPDTFKLFEEAARNGLVQRDRCQCAISWQLQVTDAAGRTTQVGVAHFLFSESQPAADHLWFYPVVPDRGEDALLDECAALMGVKGASPTPAPAPPSPSPRGRASSRRPNR